MLPVASPWLPRLPTTLPAWPLWLVAALLFVIFALITPRRASGEEPTPPAVDAKADLEALQQAFQQVAEQVSPSVVGIRAQRRQMATLPGADQTQWAGLPEQHVAINGSGTIISADGLILTSEHVVQAATDIDVLFFDGQRTRAVVLAADPRSDFAVLQTARSGLRPATFGDWSNVARGQWVVVIGNPFGLGQDGQLSVSVGIIANLSRQLPGLGEIDDRFYNDMIQITAPINPGNSGGPLFNIRGELIGVVTAMHTRAPADDGVGFAIPMSPAKRRLIDTLAQGRPIEYGYLGATVRLPDAVERMAIGVGHGVVVQRVEPEGPAAQAGLVVNDVVLAFDTQPVTGPAQLAELVGQSPVGSTIELLLLRAGQPVPLRVMLDQRDASRVSWMRGGAVSWRGMRLTDLSDDARRRAHLDSQAHGVVVVEVERDSPAGRANLQLGDILEQIEGEPIHDTLEFVLRVRGVRGTLAVTVRNAGPRAIAP
jgi:serine protease Do